MSPQLKQWLRLGLFLLTFSTIAAALLWWLRPNQTETAPARIGYIPFSADVVFFVALDEGYFADEGLAIEPVRFNDGGEAANALLAGRVDLVAPIAYSVQLPLLDQDPDAIRMFLPLYEVRQSPVSAMLVTADSPIKSAADLKGKKVGTYTGVPQLLYLKLVLRGLGYDPERDVAIVQVAEALQLTALESGQFDALFTVEPYVTVAQARSGARVLVASPRVAYIADPFPFGAAAVSKEFLQRRPEDVKKAYRALARAVGHMRKDPHGGKGTLPKYTPISAELALRTAAYEPFTLDDRPDPAGVQRLADVMRENKLLRRKVGAAAAFLTENQLRP
jgi:NitT/TauT family transport system substrate-binding protein